MAVEMATATKYDVRLGKTSAGQYTVLTIQEDLDRFAALCRELGIASDGTTAMEAAINVQLAVKEAVEVSRERGISPGEAVDDEGLFEFLQNHRGPDPMTGFSFTI